MSILGLFLDRWTILGLTENFILNNIRGEFRAQPSWTQLSGMELLVKTVSCLRLMAVFTEIFVCNVWFDSECTSGICRETKNIIVPFYGWGSTASRLDPLRGGEIPGAHLIDLRRIKGWVKLGTSHWFWTWDPRIGNPVL